MGRRVARFLTGIVLGVCCGAAVYVWLHDIALSVFVGAMVAITVWFRALDRFSDIFDGFDD